MRVIDCLNDCSGRLGVVTPSELECDVCGARFQKVDAYHVLLERERQTRNAAGRMGMRRFQLVRDVDVSGVSGTGVVAEGVEFSSGKVTMCWNTPRAAASIAVYDSLEDLITIHGHQGASRVELLDE